MNTYSWFHRAAGLVAIAGCLAAGPSAAQQDGSWSGNAGANWSATGSWLGGTVADGATFTAWFTNNISANFTVTIDGAKTIGHIVLGDYNGGNAFTLTTNTTGSLTFDNGAGASSLTLARGPSTTINSPIQLLSDLTVASHVGNGTNLIINGTISGVNRSLIKEGIGRLILNRTNTYTGATIINNGVVRIADSRFLNQSSNMTLNGGVLEIGTNTFSRPGGLGTASNQIQILGGNSGFSIYDTGGDRTVQIGAGGSVVKWGTPYFDPSIFILNTTGATASRILVFDNAIDLNGADREIDTVTGIARANRPITNSAGTAAGLIKGGSGTLELTATNRYDGTTTVLNGSLRLYGPFTLSTNNTLVLNGGVVEFARTHTYQTPILGTGAGKVQFAGAAGFGAHNGIREVNVNGTGEILKMGDGDLANWGSLLLNGASSGGRVLLQNGLDLNGASRTVSVGSAYGAVLGPITNTAGTPAQLQKIGNGTLLVLGDNYRHDGGTWIRAGTMQLGDYWVKNGVLPGLLGGGSSVSNSGQLLVANLQDTTISGNIEGSGYIAQAGWGSTLTLSGTNAYTGSTVIRRGTIALDFAAATAPADNIIGTGAMSPLILGEINYTGGTLSMQGADGQANGQIFRSLTVNQGVSAIRVASGAGGSATLAVSNIVRNLGGTLDFTLPASGAIRTTALNVNGILGGYATVDGTHWAANSVGAGEGNVEAYSAYTYATATIPNSATEHVRLDEFFTSDTVTLAAATTEIATLSTEATVARTVDLAVGETLRLGTIGGILSAPGAGTLTIGTTVNQGRLTAGAGANGPGELVFINNSANPIEVNASILSNGTGRLTMTKAGAGALNVYGNATLSISNFFNEGAANFHGSTTLGVTRVNGGSLNFLGGDNKLNGHLIVQGGSVAIDAPVNGQGYEIQMNQTHGGRSVLYINDNLTINRVRPSLNDNNFGVGAVFQTNGTVFTLTAGTGVTLAEGAGSYGYYRMMGGSITGDVLFASRGTAVFEQFGGLVGVSNQFRMSGNDGYSVANLHGGLMNAPGNASAITVTEHAYGGGTAVINMLGGVLDTAFGGTGKGFNLMSQPGNTTYLNLMAGAVTANQINASQSIGNSVLNLNGGTLVAKSGTSLGGSFLQGLTAAYVYPGGANVDVQAANVTFNQSLTLPIRNGLFSIPTNGFTGGQYIGAPAVKITGGSGTGAMAVAQVDFTTGAITNFLVVNPGTGYLAADVLTVTLEGGGPMTPPVPFTVSGASLVANSGGGLTKTGPGTLVLGRINSYTGATVVNNGVLRLADSRWIDTSVNVVLNGGILEIVSNNFARANGLGQATAQIQIPGGMSGFSVNGNGARTFTVGPAASELEWGSAYFNPSIFVLQTTGANQNLTLDNAIDLNGADRQIAVIANLASINRPITNGAATAGGLVKSGAGILNLGSALNNYDGTTTVLNGMLRIANPGALSTNNTVILNGGILEFGVAHPYLTPTLGTGAGTVQFAGAAGFGVRSSMRTVNVNGTGETLKMGDGALANFGSLLLNATFDAGHAYLIFANGLDLNGSARTVQVGNGFARIDGPVINTAGSPAMLEKTGIGTLVVADDNYQHDGGTFVRAGTLQLGQYWLRDGTMPGVQGNAGNLINNGTLVVANIGDTTLSGNIEGTGALVQSGWGGTLTLSGTNTYTGATIVRRGTLELDFGGANAPAANVIGSGAMSALTLGTTSFHGGTLLLTGSNGLANTQTFRSLAVAAGRSEIAAVSGAGGSVTLALSNITRSAGGVLDFTLPASGSIQATNLNTRGILGGYATVDGTDWATVSTPGTLSAIQAFAGYVKPAGAGPIIASDTNTNLRLDSGSTGNATLGAAVTTISTLSTEDAAARTINLGGQTLRLGEIGGILAAPLSGGLTIGTAYNNGVLTAGRLDNTTGELVFLNNSANPIVVNSRISSNGTQRIQLTKAGAGAVDFVGDVALGNNMFILDGTATFRGTNVLGATTVTGGDLVFATGSSNRLTGTMTIAGGSVTVNGRVHSSGEIYLGSVSGARSVLYINDDLYTTRLRGAHQNEGNLTAGAIFQTGGILLGTGAGTGLTISDGTGNYGYYGLVGGVVSGDVVVAYRGPGVMEITGGAVTPSNQFQVVNNTGYGLVNLLGGRFNAPGTATGYIPFHGNPNQGGTAVFNVLGGSLDAAYGGTGKAIDLMNQQGNVSYLNLIGGVVTANQIKATQTIGNSVLNLNGGTVVAAANSSMTNSFISGLTAAYVYGGGATVDVAGAGAKVTVLTGLQAPTDYGLTAIPVDGNSGGQYIGAPVVRITGGSGTGALAIAQVNFATGSITNYLVVNPGTGYQAADVLTIELEGGGPLVAPTNFTISGAALAANTSGGITKTGNGILVLAGTNTFTGAINVDNGFLDMAYAAPGATNITLGATAGMGFGVGGANTLTEAVIANLLATKFAPGNSFGLDTSAGSYTWTTPIGGVTDFYKLGNNTLILPVASTYSGATYIMGGALLAEWGTGVPAGSHMVLNGGAWETTGGTAVNWGAGAGQFEIAGGTSGFSAVLSPLTVDLGGAGALRTWGEALFTPEALVLNAPSADQDITLVNPLDLGGTNATIVVGAQSAYLAGGLTNTAFASGQGGLVKLGAGTLVLSNAAAMLNLQANPGLQVRQGTLLVTAGRINSQSPANNNDYVGRFAGDDGTLILAGTAAYVRNNNHLYIGTDAGSRGTMIVQDNASFWGNYRIIIGNSAGSTGVVQQTGGTVYLGNDTYIGNGGVGTYTLSGGLLSNATTYVGNANLGNGRLNLSGGLYRGGALNLGNNVGAMGLVVQSGGTGLVTGGITIGDDAAGRYVLAGGFLTNGSFTIGNNATGVGVMLQTGGVLRSGSTTIGNNLGSAGAFFQTGGSSIGYGLTIANNYGSYGSFEMLGGMRTNTYWIQVGTKGLGVYVQSGGTNWVSGSGMLLDNGSGLTPATGVAYFSGGVYTSSQNIVLGYHNNTVAGGRAEFTVDGGNVMLNNMLLLNRQKDATTITMATNIVNLNAGIFRTTYIRQHAPGGRSVFNFNGGTLLVGASVSNATFLQGLDAAFVYGGGATIDTFTNTAVIAQDLLAPSGQGVTTLPWSGDLGGYIGAPYVQLTGGGGFGATAVALFDYATGNVTGLVITSSGSGYAPGDTVTATLVGGGHANVELGAATLGDVGSGGLTKLGNGTLILGGDNSYTGATTVATGMLEAFRLASLPSAAVLTVNPGAAFTVGVGGAGQWLAADVDNLLATATFNAGSYIGFDTALGDFTYGTGITGTKGLVKMGTNTLTLSGANTYGAGTWIANGRVVLEADEGLGTGGLMIGGPGTVGALSLSNASQTVAAMLVRSTPFLTNSIHIGDGQSLVVLGYVTNGVREQNSRTLLTVDGAGTWAVTNTPTGLFQVGSLSNATTIVDLHALGAFSADLGNGTLAVGPTDGSAGTSTNFLFLATNSTIVAGRINIGDGVASTGGRSTLALGAGANALYADLLVIASGKQNSDMLFAGESGTLSLSNRLGDGRANLAINANRVGTGANRTALLDLRGHEASLYIGNLTNAAGLVNSASWGLGQIYFDQGVMDVQNAYVGLRTGGAAGNGGVTGEVHIGGGSVMFESVELARNSVANSSNVVGLLNFHGGTIAVGGNITKGGGAGPATAVLLMTNSATLDMNGYAIGSGANPIDTLQLDSGTLRNVGEINGGAAWTKNGAGTLTLEGVNTYAGNLTAALGTLRYNGTYTGGGLITIQGGATLAGTGTVGAVTVDAGGLLSPGNSAGTLTVGDLTLDGGTLLYYELLTTGTSDLILAGTTILGGVDFDNFTFLPGVGFGPGVYTLIDATAISGLGAATTGTVGGYDAALSIDNDNQDLQLTVIPEPTTLALFALCAAAALLRRRMR